MKGPEDTECWLFPCAVTVIKEDKASDLKTSVTCKIVIFMEYMKTKSYKNITNREKDISISTSLMRLHSSYAI